jgi:hypothetical protein
VSATTFYSGSSELGGLLSFNGVLSVSPGLNAYTGGTLTRPILGLLGDMVLTSITSVSLSASTVRFDDSLLDASIGNSDQFFYYKNDGLVRTNPVMYYSSGDSAVFSNALYSTNLSADTIFLNSVDITDVFATKQSMTGFLPKSGGTGGPYVLTGTTSIIGSASLGAVTGTTTSVIGWFAFHNDVVSIHNTIPATAVLFKDSGALQVMTGDSSFSYNKTTSGLTAVNISGATLYSGITELSVALSNKFNSAYAPISVQNQWVQPGNNISTGGTPNAPQVSLVASPSVFNLVSSGVTFAPTLSGNTLYSGASELGGLLAQTYAPISVVPTYVQPGINTTTGGTIARPIIHVVGSPSFTAVTASSVSGTSVSATTFYSGNTNLNYLLGQSSTPATYVQPGVNITTGGTVTSPIVHVSGSPSFTAVTAGTYTSGATELSIALSNKFNSAYAPISVQNQWVQPGLNMTTGGTPNAPIINLGGSISLTAVTSPTVTANTALSARGTNDFTDSTNTVTNSTWNSTDASPMTFGGGVLKFDRSILYIGNKSTFSADVSDGTTRFVVGRLGEFESGLKITGNGEVSSNFSATTYYSGNTLLTTSITNLTNSLYAPISVVATYAQNGNQITTGGTITRPTLNLVSSPAVNNLIASGVSYGATVSGATIYEGSTLLSSKYAPKDLSVTLNSGTYILALTDDSRLVDMSGASTQNVVVPRNSSIAFPIGSQVMVAQTGAGQVSFSADTGVTILSYNSQVKLTGLYATASLVKKDTNTWLLGGNLTT